MTQDPMAALLLRISAELEAPARVTDDALRALLHALKAADPAALPVLAAQLERRRVRAPLQ